VFGHLTYLVLEVIWAAPVLLLQWAFGYRPLFRSARLVALAVLVPTLYLAVADGIAIHAGIWRLHPNRIIGINFAGLPIEEIIFFLATNLMIVQTVVLIPVLGHLRSRWTTRLRFVSGR
jgi:lycopene beta-cyclase